MTQDAAADLTKAEVLRAYRDALQAQNANLVSALSGLYSWLGNTVEAPTCSDCAPKPVKAVDEYARAMVRDAGDRARAADTLASEARRAARIADDKAWTLGLLLGLTALVAVAALVLAIFL